MTAVDLLSRWVHIFSAILLFGGTLFLRFVVHPATASLPDSERDDVRGRLTLRWKRYVHLSIGLLLLSGLWNFARAIVEKKEYLTKAYHPLLGTKILLSLVVFFFASVLVGKSAKFEGMRQNKAKWMTITIVLAAIVVCLAGAAKILGYDFAPQIVMSDPNGGLGG